MRVKLVSIDNAVRIPNSFFTNFGTADYIGTSCLARCCVCVTGVHNRISGHGERFVVGVLSVCKLS